MRILIVADTLLLGGAEWFLLRQYKYLKQNGFCVKLFVTRPDCVDKRLIDQFPDLQYHSSPLLVHRMVKIIDRILCKFFNELVLINELNRCFIRLILLRFKPSIIQSHLFQADIKVHKASIGLNIPHVITNHGDYNVLIKQSDKRNIKSVTSLLRSVSRVVIISDEQNYILQKFMPELAMRISKIYNGYPFMYKHIRKEKGDFVFGMIARGIPEKGWEIAILAFLLLNRKNIQLILIGESQYLQYLREKYPCPTIIFQGFSSDPLKAVQQFDVGLFPSYYASESLPTTIIEYLLSCKPVITSDVGECATMITHNGDLGGIILPIEKGIPEVNDLVSAMKRFLDDHLYYIHCSTIARSASKKFEMKFCMNEYIKMYKNLVEENQTDLA